MSTAGFSVVSRDDDETALVNKGTRFSSKSPSLARSGKKEGARKLTRLDPTIPIWEYIFKNLNGMKCAQKKPGYNI